MRVGVPKEIKTHEYRVGLTPGAVREYVGAGHSVLVETAAGLGIGADDAAYQKAGAIVVDTSAEIFATADMIVKVKEPQPAEWSKLKEGQILFTYLHLAPDPDQARGLMDSGCTAIAYETVSDGKGGLPLLAPMSEVAGRLSIEAAASRSGISFCPSNCREHILLSSGRIWTMTGSNRISSAMNSGHDEGESCQVWQP